MGTEEDEFDFNKSSDFLYAPSTLSWSFCLFGPRYLSYPIGIIFGVFL
jgi:hypothetical protein